MIRSMTGFARISGTISDRFSLSLVIRSVNHRYLEVSVRIPERFWELESSVRSILGEFVVRGKVDVNIRLQQLTEPDYAVRVNRSVASAVLPELRAILEKEGTFSAFSVSDLLRVPDLITVEPLERELTDEEQESFRALVRSGGERLREMRTTEGMGLRTDIEGRIDAVDALRQTVFDERESIQAELAEAFRQRISEIVRATDSAVSEDRVAQELVILAEKSDVAEELTRMKLHLDEVRKLIRGEEPAGKKLDFLSQEILREINTLGQKSRSARIRGLVVELKTEVERIREQVQNVE